MHYYISRAFHGMPLSPIFEFLENLVTPLISGKCLFKNSFPKPMKRNYIYWHQIKEYGHHARKGCSFILGFKGLCMLFFI
jgi:hypothetical protein